MLSSCLLTTKAPFIKWKSLNSEYGQGITNKNKPPYMRTNGF